LEPARPRATWGKCRGRRGRRSGKAPFRRDRRLRLSGRVCRGRRCRRGFLSRPVGSSLERVSRQGSLTGGTAGIAGVVGSGKSDTGGAGTDGTSEVGTGGVGAGRGGAGTGAGTGT